MVPQVRTLERRKLAVKLLKQGKTQAEVARMVGSSREAVRLWWDAYEEKGAAGLKSQRKVRGGPKWAVTDDDLARLRAVIKTDKLATLADIHRASARLRLRISRSALRRRLVSAGLW